MLRMRLRRTGAKKQPSYRIVIMESQSPRDGAFVDWLGFYDPLTDPPTVRINEERARHWLDKGVSPSDTMRGLLRRAGVVATAESAPPESDAPAPAPSPDRSSGTLADEAPLESEAPAPRRSRARSKQE